MPTTIDTNPVQTAVNRQPAYEQESKKIIQKYTLAAALGGAIPVMGLDVAAAAAAQVFMIKDLAKLYDVAFEEEQVSVVINSALGSVIARTVTIIAGAALPGSSGPTSLVNGAVSGIYTATVGEFYKLHFREGGTLSDVRIGDLGNYFVEEVKRGDLNMSMLTNPTKLAKYIF